MPNFNLQQRWERMSAGKVLAIGTEVDDELVSTPTLVAAGSTGYRVAMGTGTLASGTVAVATGLRSVVAFTADVSRTATPTTGAAEVNQIWIGTITTGSVVVTGSFNSFVTGAATVSASGTASFYWLAVGT